MGTGKTGVSEGNMLRFIKYVFTFGIAMGVAVAVAVAYIIYDVS